MDKSWMHADRRSRTFELGVEELIKFALDNGCDVNSISCPCVKCNNGKSFSAKIIKDHLFWLGIDESYTNWIWHGEPDDNEGESEETVELEVDLGIEQNGEMENDIGMEGSQDEEFSEDSNEFLRFVEEGDKPLYPGCVRFTKLNALVQTICALGCGNPTERSCALANRFISAKKGQHFMLPYNSGCHWMLTVVNPEEEIIYFMDPLRRRLCTGEWQSIVDNGLKIYNAQRNKSGKKTIVWKNLSGIPAQQNEKDCGLFIMRYMKDIVEDKNMEFATKWERRGDRELIYSQKDLNVVRGEWAKFVLKNHT